jgi:hypothetical protein
VQKISKIFDVLFSLEIFENLFLPHSVFV